MRIVPIATALVVAVGLGRGASVHLYKEWYRRGLETAPRVDMRYAALLGVLPAGERLGYLSDAPVGEARARRYFEAAYALAPRLLDQEPARARWIVADLEDPSRLGDLCARHGLRPVTVAGAVALLERASP